MPKNAPDLSGVQLKLDRAEEHIDTVRQTIVAFLKREPRPFGYRTETTTRPDKSIECVLYAVVREQPPRTLAPMIGDAIHNIRSALDHLVYELASPSERNTGRTEFPIFSDEGQFKKHSPAMLKGITGDARTLIQRVQPYIASNPPRHDPLAILKKLSNLDKHRLLVPMIAAVSEIDSMVASDNAEIRFEFLEPGPVEHDARIMAFTATPRDPSVEMPVSTQTALQIGLRDTGADDLRLEVIRLLGMLHDHVQRSVIDWWFKYGQMPLTWAEVQALQSAPP